MPVRLNTSDANFAPAFQALLNSKREDSADVSQAVAAIIHDVIAGGDEAVLALTQKFDGVSAASMADLALGADDLAAAYDRIDDELKSALNTAAHRIRAFHERQLPSDIAYTDEVGVGLSLRHTPVDAAGLYVPRGKRLIRRRS